MATLGDMITYVSQRLLDVDNVAVSTSSVAASLNDAIRYWKYRRFWFNQELAVDNMTEQDPVIPMPNDFLCFFTDTGGPVIRYSAMNYPLTKISQQSFEGMYLTNGYGLPYYYARVNDEYQVYPIPDRAYEIRIQYLKDYSALVNNSDTNDFTDNAERLIELWALANLSAELRQDDKMESYYRQAAQDEYRQLCVMNDKSNGSGRLTIYSNL